MPVSVPDTIPDTTPEQPTEPTPETLPPTAAQGIDLSQTQGEIDLAQTDLKKGVIFDENAKGIFNNL
jgi:GH25 family lysozyme M1 (1,4-beta-N-acetylmuramidase)